MIHLFMLAVLSGLIIWAAFRQPSAPTFVQDWEPLWEEDENA